MAGQDTDQGSALQLLGVYYRALGLGSGLGLMASREVLAVGCCGFGFDEEVVVAVAGALTPLFVLNQGSRRDSGQLEEGATTLPSSIRRVSIYNTLSKVISDYHMIHNITRDIK